MTRSRDPSRTTRLLLALGEGALVGMLVGGILGVWEVHANADLQHGMLRLAALRILSKTCAGAMLGIGASIALALAGGLRHGPRAWRIAGMALAAVGAAFGLGALALSPLAMLRLVESSGDRFSSLMIGSMATVGVLLLGLRGLDVARDWRGSTPPAMRVRLVVSWLALAGLAGVLVSSAAAGALLGASGRASVLLVSIDTLRADRLGALSRGRTVTPNLDRLVAEGALFLQATAPAPWTLPSHGSIFSSLLPYDHRGHRKRIPLDVSLLAERFRDAGYRTAAFTGGGYVHADRGFDQGFEIYENHDELEEAGDHLSRAATWIEGLAGAPFFVFAHTYEAHSPFVRSEFADPGDAGRIGESFDADDLRAIRKGEIVPTEAERRFMIDLYDGEVAHADRRVGRFLRELEDRRLLEGVVVVVLSDHGEELWDHYDSRSPDHGHSLYEELLRVPLVFWRPGLIRPGLRIRTPVSLLDVAPTLLALAGLPPDPQHRGHDLSRVLRSGGEPPIRPVAAEATEYGPDRFSLRQGDVKVIFTPFPDQTMAGVHLDVEPLEVFDLSADPLERRNLGSDPSGAVGELTNLVTERATRTLREFETRPHEKRSLSEDQLRQLRALGYAE